MSDKPKIKQMAGKRLSPRTLYAMALEEADEDTEAVVLTLTADGYFSCRFSAMTNERMCYIAQCFEMHVQDIITGRYVPDGTDDDPTPA